MRQKEKLSTKIIWKFFKNYTSIHLFNKCTLILTFYIVKYLDWASVYAQHLSRYSVYSRNLSSSSTHFEPKATFYTWA